MNDLNRPDLEDRLRNHYETMPIGSSRELLSRVTEAMDRAPRRRWPVVRLSARMAAVGALGLAALALAAIVASPLWFGQTAPAGPAATRATATATATASGGPQASITGSPTAGSPGPTFDVQGAMSAEVDDAGLIRSGGIWAVEGPYLLTSTDNGKTWQAGTMPALAGSVFVLDPDHAWAVSIYNQGGAPTVGQLVVYRTADGGKIWNQAPAAGDFPCDTATFSFVDAAHGFLECSTPSSLADGAPIADAKRGSGTVLETADGGATWSVAGGAAGLGRAFTASDASTLWSAPDYESSELTGVTLSVSRDAGRTWSTVDLPDLASIPKPADVGVAAGPVFQDASNGALAVLVQPVMSSSPQAVWFYRTSDGGRTWAPVKKTATAPLAVSEEAAFVGREWAVVGTAGFFGLTVSNDFGASWTDVPGFGMPPNTSFVLVALADESHGIATAFLSPGTTGLMLTSDGGRTWHPADFGDARTKLPVDPVQDLATAEAKAEEFAVMAFKSPESAWGMLSSYSQREFGSSSAFQAAEAALATRAVYAVQAGEPTQSADALSASNLGAGLWKDLTASAAMSRAYVVVLTFSAASAASGASVASEPPVASAPPAPPETLVVAPLAATGEWRVWVVTP
jgi:photosystem II stability/assembly factor-like uncharacterized protein